jgi:hypothetical protein
VHALAGRDRGTNQRLLRPVQLVQLALQSGDARRSLGHRQRVVGQALDLGHHEAEHSVGEQRSQQRQRITGVLGDVPVAFPDVLNASIPSNWPKRTTIR